MRHIVYAIPGPDRRYNFEIVQIELANVEQEIAWLNEAWSEYQRLKEVLPSTGSARGLGQGHWHIVVDQSRGGLAVGYRWAVRITNAVDLEKTIAGYRGAAKRAEEIIEKLWPVATRPEHWR